jgi:hypothetical protein
MRPVDGRAKRARASSDEDARALPRRRSGTLEVLLLWHPRIDGVELSVSDVTTGESFQIEVAPETAMDAFHHPFAYAARRESA